jgi:hypothetical protein
MPLQNKAPIALTEEKVMKKFWLTIKWFLSYHGMSKPPTQSQILGWLRLGKVIYEYKCLVCKRTFWALSKKPTCPRLACYLIWHGGEYASKRKPKVNTST